MKSYIIYKFSEHNIVKEQLSYFQTKCADFEPLLLPESNKKDWHGPALKKIREADCAIYFVSAESAKSPNVDWELERFIKYQKPIYTIRMEDFKGYNSVLYRKDSFGNIERMDKSRNMYSKDVDADKLIKYINNNLEMDISEEVVVHKEMDPNILMEQYKAYLQTSEDVVSRRQSVSNFYITVNSTLLSVLSTVLALISALDLQYSRLTVILGCYLVPVLGLVLCYNWRRLVGSYGQLNAAKMKVISALEKNLPFNIYDIEWKVQTDRLGKHRYVSFTRIEKLIPFLFSVIYVIILIIAVVLTVTYIL